MMQYVLIIVAATALGGCSAAAVPVPGDAMDIVWEQAYGMETASRPSVTWHDGCRVTDSTGNRATSIKDGCVVAIVHDDGTIELQSASRVSESTFALALEQWREWLTASAFAPIDGRAVADANADLVGAGL